ncbi:PEBP-like superfamily protein [Abortiporus biennis]
MRLVKGEGMGYSLLATAISLSSYTVNGQDTSLTTVKNVFTAANIPTDAHISFNPSVLFELTFPQATGRPIQVHAGIQLPRNATAIPPIFTVRNRVFSPRQEFVVAAVDLDAPTPQSPINAQIRHFLGGNFTPQPTPPAGSDPHRYVFLLFEQPNGFNQQTFVTANTSISNFNINPPTA